MPLPVITNVYRVTLDWTRNDGVMPRTVMHVRPSGSTTEPAVATAVGQNTQTHQFQAMGSGFRITSATALRLDGSSAGLDGTFGDTGGEQSGDIIPAACAIVSLRTAVRGPRGRGRVFLGPVGESAQVNGIISSTIVGNMQTAWEDYVVALLADPLQLELGVASYKHASFEPVDLVTVKAVMGTQRRRQAQLR